MAEKHDICASDEVLEGELKKVKVGRASVILTRLPSGEIRAVSSRCPHHGADLAFGCITGFMESKVNGEDKEKLTLTRCGEILRCPWHGFEFDLMTGEPSVAPPAATRMRLRFYTVHEENNRVVITT